jgi:two-component system, NarL family, sensor kinase
MGELLYNDLVVGISAGILLMSFTFTFITVLYIRYRRDQMKSEKAMAEMRQTYEQTLLQTQLEIQEQTFDNISQEIHDNIGQVLTLAKLNLNTVGPNIPEPTSKKIQTTKELVSQAIHDLRNLSKSLNTDLIKEIGLCEIIQREILLVSKSGQFETNFTLDGEPYRFDRQKELIVFRIFQELVNNIIKHANAKTINIQLQYQPQGFTLFISDDGDGFDTTQLQNNEQNFGLGLRNMHNRASLIGGSFKVNSAPGQGSTVQLLVKVEPAT